MSSQNFRPSSIPRSIEAFADRKLPTSEEAECERRGYKLSRVTLGKGAYARVKLASVSASKLEKDKFLMEELKRKGDNKVAIKIISKKTAPVEYLNKFMPREIDALNSINGCPNVVKLYETFRSENRVYLVMEYANKGDLLEFINSGRSNLPGIGEQKAKKFFKQLVKGLDHCHRKNIVHRDMKCENILIHEHDIIKISDFGFATRFPTTRQPLLETFCGSYAYAAPEILQAEKYDGKIADVWSLGIILFAMLNGRLPFNDRDIPTLVEQTMGKLRYSTRVEVSSDCRDLVRRILTPNQRRRITIAEMLHHSWLQKEIFESDLPLSISRGVPDGKSEKSISYETNAKKKDFCHTKDSYLMLKTVARNAFIGAKRMDTSKQGVILDKWVDKNSKSSMMANLLREQLAENIQSEALKEKRLNVSPMDETKCDIQLCDISNMACRALAHKTPAVQPKQKPGPEKSNDERLTNRKIEKHSYRYQTLESQKTQGTSCEKRANGDKEQDRCCKKPPVAAKWTEVKIPVSNLKTNGHRQIYYPGLNMKERELPDLNLPPVRKDRSQSRASTSQSKKISLDDVKRKKTVGRHQVREKLQDVKCGTFSNVKVNLRGNWLKHTSKRTRENKNNALKYYNLNGKEVSHRSFEQRGKYVVGLDVY